MTNEQIIFNKSIMLMEQGLIGTTGRSIELEQEDGSKKNDNGAGSDPHLCGMEVHGILGPKRTEGSCKVSYMEAQKWKEP